MGIIGYSPGSGEIQRNAAVMGAIRASLGRCGAGSALPAQPLDFVHELAGATHA
jgi:hypothetical protein